MWLLLLILAFSCRHCGHRVPLMLRYPAFCTRSYCRSPPSRAACSSPCLGRPWYMWSFIIAFHSSISCCSNRKQRLLASLKWSYPSIVSRHTQQNFALQLEQRILLQPPFLVMAMLQMGHCLLVSFSILSDLTSFMALSTAAWASSVWAACWERFFRTAIRASVFKHALPGCQPSEHMPQKTYMHSGHCAQWSPSSRQPALQRGQYTRSDMQSRLRDNVSASQRSKSGSLSRHLSTCGSSALAHLGVGQTREASAPSRTATWVCCCMQARQ
mmetsp:Transcript_27836/g.71671  ORF Transcript_27836/g.71671 Transcript_27836/m.71671 type:complete len:271 (+) Transcript_27836:321-1133(+)